MCKNRNYKKKVQTVVPLGGQPDCLPASHQEDRRVS
jgi:hypothetical protein